MDEQATESMTRILRGVVRGDEQAAAELLPLVYEELRKLAHSWMAKLPPGQTLPATALVHEAFMRILRNEDPGWDGRRHFFGAAARAMREILIEQARRKASAKRGGGRRRVDANDLVIAVETPAEDMLALDEALQRLERQDSRAYQVVTLRFFTGLNIAETAEMLGVSTPTVERSWRYARAWLHSELCSTEGEEISHD